MLQIGFIGNKIWYRLKMTNHLIETYTEQSYNILHQHILKFFIGNGMAPTLFMLFIISIFIILHSVFFIKQYTDMAKETMPR